ncbi:MAG TPA: DUF5668 domain-containing protein [Terriglobales bacterium]|nr:DUF5668 domain-containing protein [Terriglobales bacterium]
MADYYDDYYVRNRQCRCPRCVSGWMMGPAVLITIGVLFLLDQMNALYWDHSFPILLIVIGAVMIAKRTASDRGHIQPGPRYYPPQQPPVPPATPGPEVNRG